MVSWASILGYSASSTLEELAWESTSMRSVFLPRRARPAVSEIEVLLFPVPPFCEATAIIILGKVTASATNGLWILRQLFCQLLEHTGSILDCQAPDFDMFGPISMPRIFRGLPELVPIFSLTRTMHSDILARNLSKLRSFCTRSIFRSNKRNHPLWYQ